MKDLIGTAATNPQRVSATIPPKMLNELSNGFVEVRGVVAAKGRMRELSGKQHNDETGIECLLNHIHIDDFVD